MPLYDEKYIRIIERIVITVLVLLVIIVFYKHNQSKSDSYKSASSNASINLPPKITGNRFYPEYISVLELNVKQFLIDFNDNPVSYFESELSEKIFNESPLYKEILDTLKYLRQQLLQNEYYIVIDNMHKEYDIRDSCFLFYLGTKTYKSDEYRHPLPDYTIANSDYTIRFKNMPLKKGENQYIEMLSKDVIGNIALAFSEGSDNPDYAYNIYVPVPIPMNNALEIERNSDDYHLLIYFKISSISQSVIHTKYNRIVLHNKTTGDIVYTKTYH